MKGARLWEELEGVLQKGQWSEHGALESREGSILCVEIEWNLVCLDQTLTLRGCKGSGNDRTSARPRRA